VTVKGVSVTCAGDAAEETELLTWLLYQMKEDTIENINRDLLNKMIDDFEFLAVFFCKSHIHKYICMYVHAVRCTAQNIHIYTKEEKVQMYIFTEYKYVHSYIYIRFK
jgi:hypothetical protein